MPVPLCQKLQLSTPNALFHMFYSHFCLMSLIAHIHSMFIESAQFSPTNPTGCSNHANLL